MLPTFVIGASYQLMLQDDKYYDVPRIFTVRVGEDFSGNSAAVASSLRLSIDTAGMIICIKKDNWSMLLAVWNTSFGSIGIKVGRVLFDRSGEIGSTNLWSGYTNPANGTSLGRIWNPFSNYNHWNSQGSGGVLEWENVARRHCGRIVGNCNAITAPADSSYYNYPSSSYSSQYLSSGSTQQDWKHDGTTILYGLISHPGFLHNTRWSFCINIRNRISILDSLDYPWYILQYYSNLYLDTLRTSVYNSFLRDTRSGSEHRLLLLISRFQRSMANWRENNLSMAFNLIGNRWR